MSSRFRCTDTKIDLGSIQTLERSHFRSPHKNQFNSDLYTEIKVNSDPPHWNRVNSDHPRYTQTNFIPKMKSSQVPFPERKSTPTTNTKPRFFWCSHSNEVISGPHTKNKSTKNQANRSPQLSKLCSARTQEPSQLRYAHQNQAIFGQHTETKSILTPEKIRVNFDPHTGTTPISIQNTTQVNFDPITEIMSISIPTLTSSLFRCPDTKIELISILTLKTSHFRPLHKKQSHFRSCLLYTSPSPRD